MLPPPLENAAAASSDLRTGTCLAVASSALIGASFCVKKRALRVAGAVGLRAGLCVCTLRRAARFSPLPFRRRRLWIPARAAMVGRHGCE